MQALLPPRPFSRPQWLPEPCPAARLRTLKGAEFDRAFLQHEAAFHKAVIDALQSTLLPAIDNAELKALVEKVAPAFQAHMQMAQELEKKLGEAS